MKTEVESLLSHYCDTHLELFSLFDPVSCIEAFDQISSAASYHSTPAAVSTTWNEVAEAYGKKGFGAFQAVTMLRLIRDFEARSSGRNYTAEVRQCFAASFERIATALGDPDYDGYRETNDLLLKDLAICRQKMFPAGAQVVEPNSAFHRSVMFVGGIAQAFRVVKLLYASGSNKQWYQIHTHLSELNDFNPEGWDQCYLRLADMLTCNPEIRGMWGGSWFYDPALESISPRLAYLRAVPQSNGASVFYSNVDINGGALSKSATRNKAYESGQYMPKSYLVIWPRKQLIQWAERMRRLK